MASHGIPRASTVGERSAATRAKELKEIDDYQRLVNQIDGKVEGGEFTPELLQQTAELLKKNPEYYTIWNHRRRIYENEFSQLKASVANNQLSVESEQSQILDIIQLDLQFLFPLLLQFPKCYWIWNHRLWLLDQSTLLLPTDKSLVLWRHELGLVGQMLTRDSRNFHGWGYRRTVVSNLESLTKASMGKEEFEYTTKMISANLSNFSAWHNRSKLTLRILDEQNADDAERKRMLDEELELIHRALFDPYDQSLWFYHQNLMSTFDPAVAQKTMAPDLSTEDRLQYVQQEQDFVGELLEDTDDCKWIYQASMELAILETTLRGVPMSEEKVTEVVSWLGRLKKLDPLRQGRWDDLLSKYTR